VSTAQRAIDAIGALIDEQLRAGEPETGFDFDDPDFPECRCGLDWHGLPKWGCPGSYAEGPVWKNGPDTFGTWYEMPHESYNAAASILDRLVQRYRESHLGAESHWPTRLAFNAQPPMRAVDATRMLRGRHL
jgi:hypothetical protein